MSRKTKARLDPLNIKAADQNVREREPPREEVAPASGGAEASAPAFEFAPMPDASGDPETPTGWSSPDEGVVTRVDGPNGPQPLPPVEQPGVRVRDDANPDLLRAARMLAIPDGSVVDSNGVVHAPDEVGRALVAFDRVAAELSRVTLAYEKLSADSANCREALGLISTAVPDFVMAPSDMLELARAVVDRVRELESSDASIWRTRTVELRRKLAVIAALPMPDRVRERVRSILSAPPSAEWPPESKPSTLDEAFHALRAARDRTLTSLSRELDAVVSAGEAWRDAAIELAVRGHRAEVLAGAVRGIVQSHR